LSIIFGPKSLSNDYFAYLVVLILFNIIEIATTNYIAIEVRKGRHLEWWLVGPLTKLICKP
jgi:hypothetical protein